MLSDFSAAFHGGKRYALMGKSGIGKTTLFRILMGLEMSDSGSLDFLPENPSFSAVFQEDRLFESSDAVTNICAVTKGLSRSEALFLPERRPETKSCSPPGSPSPIGCTSDG